jgi:hypothetical protein
MSSRNASNQALARAFRPSIWPASILITLGELVSYGRQVRIAASAVNTGTGRHAQPTTFAVTVAV